MASLEHGKLVVTADEAKAAAEIAELADDIRQSIDRLEVLLARLRDEAKATKKPAASAG